MWLFFNFVGATFGRPYTCGLPSIPLYKITYSSIITDFLYISFVVQILLLTTKP